MAFEIGLKPNQVWDFYNKNVARLADEMVSIAKNGHTGYEIFLTEEEGVPMISVYKDDKMIYEEGAVSESDTEKTVREIYQKYLLPMVVVVTKDNKKNEETTTEEDGEEPSEEEMTRMDQEDQIYEREDAIYLAFQDFLQVLAEDDYSIKDTFQEEAEVNEIIDHIVEFLAIDHGIRIRRPMFIQDTDTGLEEFSEYPYEEYDFREEAK